MEQFQQGLYADLSAFESLCWQGDERSLAYDLAGVHACLAQFARPVYVVRRQGQLGFTTGGRVSGSDACSAAEGGALVIAALPVERLGDASFCATYATKYACYGGSMANGISSEEMVIALGRAGLMGSFGAAGVPPARLEAAIQTIQAALPAGPYAFNLIHSPNEGSLERRVVELYLRYGVRVIEASAFLDLSADIVAYRAAGLSEGAGGEVLIANRVIAKVSRREVAARFMAPAPADMLQGLVAEGRISAVQARLAQRVPVADDITVEADSGGHTDNRPLVCLLPGMLALRDEMQMQYGYRQPVRIGAAGGISTPGAALAAFMMGAAYLVTGSVNQACVEAGTSQHIKNLLAKASMADVVMAPSADMFEMGVKVQLLKSGTLFPMRAQKLYDLYSRYAAWEEIPIEEHTRLEQQIFKRSFEEIWQDTVAFFNQRDPEQIQRAKDNPRRKMALVFRWYLGLSSRWAAAGEKGREMDYQIWCGPAMGAFNDWARGTYLAEPGNRRVVDVNLHLLAGCSYLYRLQALHVQGVRLPAGLEAYRAAAPLV